MINFLKGSLATVYEADAKSLFAIKNDVHTPTARHLARCKSRFEFRCQSVIEKLTTEIKIFTNSLQTTKEKKPALATIEGHKRQVSGFDEKGNLVLADGQRYIFERLNCNLPAKPADEPEGDIFGWPLLEVAKLEQWQGDWKWNDDEKFLSQWIEAEAKNFGDATKAFNQSVEYVKRRMAKSRLDALPPIIQQETRGVAWFKHDDIYGMDGEAVPILLKSFRPLATNAMPERSKTIKARQPKPVARFERDYSVAVIPQKKGKETPLPIEPELQALIMKIIAAGGNIPRTKLRTGKSDSYQPEKLLMSKTAKALIKTKLLGTHKSGRTTVFWAKRHAA